MMTSPDERRALLPLAPKADDLEPRLAAVESQLSALARALNSQDVEAIDQVAAGLHAALSAAVDHFSRAARSGGVPPPLRQRLALAGGQVAAQREALARATASLDRAMDVLLPRPATNGLYSALGGAERQPGHGGSLLA